MRVRLIDLPNQTESFCLGRIGVDAHYREQQTYIRDNHILHAVKNYRPGIQLLENESHLEDLIAIMNIINVDNKWLSFQCLFQQGKHRRITSICSRQFRHSRTAMMFMNLFLTNHSHKQSNAIAESEIENGMHMWAAQVEQLPGKIKYKQFVTAEEELQINEESSKYWQNIPDSAFTTKTRVILNYKSKVKYLE